MKKSTYESMMRFWQKRPKAGRIFALAASVCSAAIYAIYPLFGLYILLAEQKKLLMYLIIPAFVFGFVTILRKILDLPRPYAYFGIPSLLGKSQKTGQSFPSRHTASAVVIACACWWVNPLMGAIVAVMAAFIAVSRIWGGAHFPKDVLVAIGISLFSSVLYFFA